MDSPVNLKIWGFNSSVKHRNCQMTYTNYLFIMVKDSVGPITLFQWADNRRMSPYWATKSPKQQRIFLSLRLVALPRLNGSVCPTILSMAGKRIPACRPFLKVLLVLYEMQIDLSRIWTLVTMFISFDYNHIPWACTHRHMCACIYIYIYIYIVIHRQTHSIPTFFSHWTNKNFIYIYIHINIYPRFM